MTDITKELHFIEDARIAKECERQIRKLELDNLYKAWVICNHCPLYKTRTAIVFHRGNPMAEVVFVGESPGATEDRQGIPFVGRSGKLLDSLIVEMGLLPDDVYICNSCLCRPPDNRKPTKEEIATCRPRLIKQLDIIRPKIIVALGGSAAEALLGPGPAVTARRKDLYDFNGIPVKVTYHPAYCLRNPKAKIQVREDLKEVMKFLELEVVVNNEGK